MVQFNFSKHRLATSPHTWHPASAVAWADKWTSSQPRGGCDGGNLLPTKWEVRPGGPACRSHTSSPTAWMDVWQESQLKEMKIPSWLLFCCLHMLKGTLNPFHNHTSQESGHGNRTRFESSSALRRGVRMNSETQLLGFFSTQCRDRCSTAWWPACWACTELLGAGVWWWKTECGPHRSLCTTFVKFPVNL